MATKQISQLPSTNTSNNSDLLMTRQGAEDKAVTVEKVRNIGTEEGQSLGVGGYGYGGDAIPITDLFASNNADLINRDGHYLINGATNVPVAQGEIEHTQTSATSATQKVVGENEEFYFRKKVAGVWKAWVLVAAKDKALMRTDLDVYSKSEGDATYLNESANLSDIPNPDAARANLNVYSKSEALADASDSILAFNLSNSCVTNDKILNQTIKAAKFKWDLVNFSFTLAGGSTGSIAVNTDFNFAPIFSVNGAVANWYLEPSGSSLLLKVKNEAGSTQTISGAILGVIYT